MEFISLPGLTSFADARELQLAWVEERIHDRIPDRVLFVEHHPVITRGRGLQYTGEQREERSKPLLVPIPEGVEYSECERGGDLTFHGPGQLVMYPIVKLDGQGFGPHHDVEGFIRKLEQVVMNTLKQHYGIVSKRSAQASGVWIRSEKTDKKMASVGIAVRKWVTYHGLALNVVNDLSSFQMISPCGFDPEVMTSLATLKPEVAQNPDWRSVLENQIATVATNAVTELTGDSSPENPL